MEETSADSLFEPQPDVRDKCMKSQVRDKLKTVHDKQDIVPGKVESLTWFFPVPKGNMDIHLVYDKSCSGLNSGLWAPWFPLPTIRTLLHLVEIGTYMADVVIGEMFLNFMFHKSLTMLAGVDLRIFFQEEIETWV